MGVLKVINDSGIDFESVPLPKKSNVKSNSIELLKKYVKESSEARLTFVEFAKKYNLGMCAVLEQYNDKYMVSDSIGLDGFTVITTIATPDFWNGTIPSRNQWYKFSTSDNTITPFYQFLSFNMKERIENIYIYYTDTNKILFLCSDNEIDLSNDKLLLDDFRFMLKIEDKKEIDNEKIEIELDTIINKYSIEFEKAVKTFLALNLENLEYLNYFKKVFHKIVWYTLNTYFNRFYNF